MNPFCKDWWYGYRKGIGEGEVRGDARGDVRGDTSGLEAWAGDKVERRGSRDASLGASRGAGDRGDRGGEGAPEGYCFGGSSLFTFTTGPSASSFDFAEPYCESVSGDY